MVSAHVLDARDFSRHWLEDELFPLAERLGQFGSADWAGALAGRRMFCLFYEPSLRTIASFKSAMQLQGGRADDLEPFRQPQSPATESLEDVVLTLNQLQYDLIVLRYSDEGGSQRAARVSRIPVVNAGDGQGQHPTQAMLDLFTIRQELGRLDDLHVALVGDLTFERSTNSLLFMLSKFDRIKLSLVSPEMLRVRQHVRDFLNEAGVEFDEITDLRTVASKVDVIYITKAHTARLDLSLRYGSGSESHNHVSAEVVADLPDSSIVMHPLPRGEELPAEYDSDQRFVHFKQVRNGLLVRMALLRMLLS